MFVLLSVALGLLRATSLDRRDEESITERAETMDHPLTTSPAEVLLGKPSDQPCTAPGTAYDASTPC